MKEFFKKYYINRFLKNKFNHLLIILISLFIIKPIFDIAKIKFPVEELVFLGAIIFTLRAIITDKKTLHIYLFIALMAFILSIISKYELIYPEANMVFFLIETSIYLVFLIKSIIILTEKLIAEQKIEVDTIKGGICVYFLIGLAWSLLYATIYYFDKNAFSFNGREEVNLLYFSFTVLTTLGFGDITPSNKLAINLTSLEAITGQMFLAIFIARLVGLYIAQGLNKK